MAEEVQTDSSQLYYDLIHKILNHFAGEHFRDEIRVAKTQFFDNAGILDENSPSYELRMNQFFDWYFFTRELDGMGQTPLECFHVARDITVDVLAFARQLKQCVEIIRHRADAVVVGDRLLQPLAILHDLLALLGLAPEVRLADLFFELG